MFKPVKVIEIELSRPLVPITGLDGWGALYALIRWHGTPLGYLTRPLQEGSCSTAALAGSIARRHGTILLRHRLRAALQTPWQPPDGPSLADLLTAVPPAYAGHSPLVTVAVCTRDRTADLSRCLDALVEVDYPALDRLVVDNAPSSDDTGRLIESQYPGVRYVRESNPGLDWARNRAIWEARGEIVAFTDDDAVVDRQWVTALVRVFTDDDEVMAVTGLVVPHELETEAQQIFEHYGGFGRGYQRRWYSRSRRPGHQENLHIGAGQFGTGANMAYRRSVFAAIGGFDPALDVGTVTHGGGDLEMFFRVIQEGFLLVYEPAAVVRHRHRRTDAQLRSQIVTWGIGFHAYLIRSALNYPTVRGAIIRFALWYFWKRHIRRLFLSLISSTDVPRPLMLAELRGALTGLGRYHQARAAAARMTGDGR